MSCVAVSFLYFMNLIYEIQTGIGPPPSETTAAPQEPESSGLTTEHKIIIGVCVSVFALIALAVIAVVAVKMYQQKKRRNQTDETQAT
ncbi:uncharacterized protein [Magallana gigas]|uniref:uncharacterized protein n=1 Tax=Magallana gigas TaxID=29159 RepID=UPI0033406692